MTRTQRQAATRQTPPQPGLTADPARVEAAFDSTRLVRLNYDPAESRESIAAAHRAWAGQHARPFYPAEPSYANEPLPDRRLRIGYLSPDLRRHPLAFFIEPVLRCHDAAEVESFCYYAHHHDDDMNQHLRDLVPNWRDVAALDDAAVASLVREDRVDILVDLAGHTGDNRLLVFARKPAPVQVTALGYVTTTGLATMDYRLTDPWCDPEGSEPYYSEVLWRLPGGFNCYAPPQGLPDPGPPPHLESGTVTFGSFNNLSKVSPELLDIWAQILERVTDSRLLLKTKTLAELDVQQPIMARLAARGIAPERVKLLDWSPTLRTHFEHYRRLDIALDTFPYNGTTTTCEALMMGVPVITLAGNRHAARVSTSILSRLGLEVLIASEPENYVGRAAALAARPDVIAELRAGLRRRLAGSPLGDAKNYTRALEAAYREMWQRWCTRQRAGQAA